MSPLPAAYHQLYSEPSEWITRWSHLIKQEGSVLDVACGFGRHMRWFHSKNHLVAAVDIAQDAINSVTNLGEAVVADIENGQWPFYAEMSSTPRQFDAVVVTNYLWRPLFPRLIESIKPGGILLYETFATGQETVGKPSRPDFLLQPGELLKVCCGMEIVAYEDTFIPFPARFVQRIAARK